MLCQVATVLLVQLRTYYNPSDWLQLLVETHQIADVGLGEGVSINY